MKKTKCHVLMILDGWGVAPKSNSNAIYLAKTPAYDHICSQYAYTELGASGIDVGLDMHQTSGSETGHNNIGAGRIVEQDSRIISENINNGNFFRNPVFLGALQHIQKNNSNLHLMGLLGNEDSPHMYPFHLEALLLMAKKYGVKNTYIHFFTDGRDSHPFSAMKHLKEWEQKINRIGNAKIASFIGRFYAMDRSKNWDRLKIAYDLLVKGKGKQFTSPKKAIQYFYDKNIGDEYFKPAVITKNGKPLAKIDDNDAVIFYNLRSDRARQFTKLFVLDDSREVELPKPRLRNLYFVGMTNFGPDLPIHTAFPGKPTNGSLPIAMRSLRQLYIAETEKFAHITYFLNGGYPEPIAGEDRIMIPSPQTDSYAKIPEMSAEAITGQVLQHLRSGKYDFIALNFANADMVGHTGDLKATISACETVDGCLAQIYRQVKKSDGTLFVTADHGNADCMWDEKTNLPMTFHTKNPVPFAIVNDKYIGQKMQNGGVLGNIAPTICEVLEIQKNPTMKLNSLLK